MKRNLLLVAIAALILSACSNKEKEMQDSMRIADLTEQYQQANSFNDSLMLLMGDIYSGLDSINMQEGLLYNMNNGSESSDRRAEVRRNLESIKARLAANRQLLAEMEAKLKNSNNQNTVLNKTIEQLKAHIESQNTKIADLENQVATQSQKIENLTTEVEEKTEQVRVETEAKEQAQQEAIAAENAANRVYYAIGTNKELKEAGLLQKKFLGATKVLQGDFDASYFTVGDKRSLTVIPTNSKKAKILTNAPAGTYEIVTNANDTKSIRILNPTKFWSLSPYLIIQVD